MISTETHSQNTVMLPSHVRVAPRVPIPRPTISDYDKSDTHSYFVNLEDYCRQLKADATSTIAARLTTYAFDNYQNQDMRTSLDFEKVQIYISFESGVYTYIIPYQITSNRNTLEEGIITLTAREMGCELHDIQITIKPGEVFEPSSLLDPEKVIREQHGNEIERCLTAYVHERFPHQEVVIQRTGRYYLCSPAEGTSRIQFPYRIVTPQPFRQILEIGLAIFNISNDRTDFSTIINMLPNYETLQLGTRVMMAA